jgi:hypothetical protein
MYVHRNIFALDRRANHKIRASLKPINELHATTLPKLPPLPGRANTLQKPFRDFGRDRETFDRVGLATDHNDGRNADVNLQPVCAVSVEDMQETIH